MGGIGAVLMELWALLATVAEKKKRRKKSGCGWFFGSGGERWQWMGGSGSGWVAVAVAVAAKWSKNEWICCSIDGVMDMFA
jgi:hypothetical protein